MGWGGGWGGKGGWGSPWQPMFMKKGWGKGGNRGQTKVDPSLKVWVGNLPTGVDWKTLETHMNQAGKTKWVESFKGKGEGTGTVVYSTAEEATNAVTMLNGSQINGQAIQVDVWVKQEKAA
eukprot:CAMPEP_0197656274 /NCGR_PEP_ID=MMETSP1338-20131121/41114_1 /TAXON_ID=43686 ORGANISM="Pelagodinium beii, Strain RCC1491" /NCGR_SAMPLE_ID=MMETSP1338 /ASSEMBLY_ACC=CAM_ASM_000754 /LENGTH=120 /DNA_ID=CAMNT_0043232201 /DNA_START=64 /DNA_END=426 /DNA_ORIENTATION=+